MQKKFIVAEITKTWNDATPATDLISMQFEAVINTNYERGYSLIEWKLTTVRNETCLTETIIAIFQLKNTIQ